LTHEEIFRQDLIEALRRELIGPDLPPYGTETAQSETRVEVLQESPIQRYSAGVLFPQRQPINEVDNTDQTDVDDAATNDEMPEIGVEEQEDDIESEGQTSDRLADAYDETIRMANEFLPSAMGITFLTEYPEDGLIINAKAAVYESRVAVDPYSKLREWLRSKLDIEPVLLNFPATADHDMKEFELAGKLRLRAIYHRRGDGSFLVTISMLNSLVASVSKPPSGADCFFQAEFEVNDPQQRFIFKEYRTLRRGLPCDMDDPDQKEEAILELLYRKRKAYAAGHGCSADWGEESDAHTNLVKTAIVPHFKVPPIEPRTRGSNELSMYHLSGADGEVPAESVPVLLENLVIDYEHWIRDRDSEVSSLPEDLLRTAIDNLKTCRDCLARIREGIDLLRSNEIMLEAFMLANSSILMQQYHSHRERRSVHDQWQDLPATYRPKNETTGRWRTFQIAFILMNLKSILLRDGGSEQLDRQVVDLIWFPTGGGKTEAYLGLAACYIFFRRLTRPTNAGCTVLTRYTLRLLTSQQFQRASSMICACEMIRRKNPSLGEEPITIGLWVGESLTPTYRVQALNALNNLAGKGNQSENSFQLLKCPWCGTALDERDNLGYVAHKFSGKPKTIVFVCPEQRCPFSTRSTDRNHSGHLPVMVIDEDIYEWPPTLIIGTVDKFAMLAWRQQAGRIFGLGVEGDYDPPDLIIQDELHLISGPLGSVVGLYESAIDLLCSRKGRQPKIVASTATIRRAWHQCNMLYVRQTFQFPPQGLDIADSFFAEENPEAPGRIYVGVFASASPSFVTAMVRALSALLQSCKSIPLPSGATEATRDPYWTIVQYFNSLRELGHAATLVEADIPEYMWAIASRSRLPRQLCRSLGPPAELTSRRTANEIPEILERLAVHYPRTSKDAPRPLDTLLATNMISVGVDVDRLGLMVVVGQPKTTSEYIQASSRIGRSLSAPGLVVTMYNPSKPRDRSHYEYFRAYHAAFYKYVEPTSVTPYSLPVLDRALHAVLVVLVRHVGSLRSPDEIKSVESSITEIVNYIRRRCQEVDPEHTDALMKKLQNLLKQWSATRPKEWGRFGHAPSSRPLMYPVGSEPLKEWSDSAWPTPSSMRNVDVECDVRVIATYEVNE
jgi:hypothetical protein